MEQEEKFVGKLKDQESDFRVEKEILAKNFKEAELQLQKEN